MMQEKAEIVSMILKDNPTVTFEEASKWAGYLQQLKGCHLYSASAQSVDQDIWLYKRKAGIGGSEISAILGENHWSSPRQVWMSKMGMFDESPRPQSEPARWGNLLETAIATEWGIRNNRKWVHIPVSIQSDEFPWLLANIDGFTLSDDGTEITGILEIKTTSAFNKDVWENGPLPYMYICQTNWYCGIAGLKQYDLVCLVGGQTLFSYTLPADEQLWEREKEAAHIFWHEHVLKGIEPPPTEVDLVDLKDVTVDEEAPPVIFEDEQTDRIIESYIMLRDKIGELKKIKDALYAQLFALMGNSSQGITQGHTMVVRQTARRSCNFDKLMEEFPEAYRECIRASVSKSLGIK